jgi:hypothetical protein
MGELGTHTTIERVESGNSLPKVLCTQFYPTEKLLWNIRKDKGNPPPCRQPGKASGPEGGGREKGGGERPDGRSKKTQETLYGYRGAFVEVSEKQRVSRYSAT